MSIHSEDVISNRIGWSTLNLTVLVSPHLGADFEIVRIVFSLLSVQCGILALDLVDHGKIGDPSVIKELLGYAVEKDVTLVRN